MNKKIFSLFFLSMATLVGTAYAASILRVSFDEMVVQSELIFHGKVVSKKVEISGNGLPKTIVTFQVNELLKGTVPDDRIDLSFLGGEKGEYTLKVESMKIPYLGEEGIYFVQSLHKGYAHPLYGWEQGHFIIKDGKVYTSGGFPVKGLESGNYSRAERELSTGFAYGVLIDQDVEKADEAMLVEKFKTVLRSLISQ